MSAEARLADVVAARREYEAALDRREHGGVAADRCLRAVFAAVEGAERTPEKRDARRGLVRALHLELLAAADMGLVSDREILDVLKVLTP